MGRHIFLGGGWVLMGILLCGPAMAQTSPHGAVEANANDADKAAANLLRAKWQQFFLSRAGAERNAAVPAGAVAAPKPDNELPLPERRGFALASQTPFASPPTAPGLDVALRVEMAHNTIGADPVHLRSYNGKLVGPTLRVKRGQTLRVTLDNRLIPDTFGTGSHNTLHDFNTTNLHSHGLHVSPSGNSDNVIMPVRANATRVYEYPIEPDHPSGTFWYHAHWHGSVAAHVGSGMAGTLIVDGDPTDNIADLEDVREVAAAQERILVLQQIPYFNEGLPEGVIEPEYAGNQFGPGDWDALQRFTTVNGVRLPVIEVQPGVVERWRIVDAGFREQIRLKIERSDGAGPEVVDMHEIALDGLATGGIRTVKTLDLYPGYRADVLVRMPDEPGEYLLVDERNMTNPLFGPENRKYIAKIKIAGAPKPMMLPAPDSLKETRLPKLESATPGPTVTYEVNLNPVRFQIDGRSFDETHVRRLTLGQTEEWTLSSAGDARADHPFHIHVNPFEVISVIDPDGDEKIDEIYGGRVWKDTIVLPYGHRVKVRTHYKKFTGKFVQHCHILDHEDQGMMEYIEIAPPSTPVPGGVPLAALPAVGKPRVILFVQGAFCPHCAAQVEGFARGAKEANVDLVVVSGASREDAQAFDAKAYQVLADPEHRLFRQYGAFDKGPKHATIVLDPAGRIVLRKVADEPFMNLQAAMSAAGGRGPAAVINATGGSGQPAAATKLRRSIDDPQFDLAAFLHAFRKVKDAPSSSLESYDTFTRLHNGGVLPNGQQGGCIHNLPDFLPWHRMLLAQFETALQNSDPPRTSHVTLPYWDFSKSPTGRRFPKAFEDQASVLWHNNRFNLLPSSPPPWVVAAQQLESDRGVIMNPGDLQVMLFDLQRYRNSGGEPGFSNALESSPHNWMHTPFTQGDMGDDVTAARDALFWSYHCYLDLMWYRWQVQHNAFEGASTELLPPDLAKQYNHFPVPMTVGQTLNPANLGYSYDLPGVPEGVAQLATNSDVLTPTENAPRSFGWPGKARAPVRPAQDVVSKPVALVTLAGFEGPNQGSYAVEFYLHPRDVPAEFDAPDFRAKYFAGQYVVWSGSHRAASTAKEDILVRLAPSKVAASRANDREHVLSVNIRQVARLFQNAAAGQAAQAADQAVGSPPLKYESLSVKFQ